MIAVAFRFRDAQGALTGHTGLAFAESIQHLMYEIHKYGDERRCELMNMPAGSFCMLQGKEVMVAHEPPPFDSKTWFSPNWEVRNDH